MTESEHAQEERRAHARRQIMALARAILHRETIAAAANATALDELTQQVAARGLDPRSAAIELVSELRSLWSD